MTIDKQILKRAVDSATSVNSVTAYSANVLRPLRYFEHTVPGFKKGALAAGVLNDVLAEVHPVIWRAVCDRIPVNKGGRAKCPACGECFFTERGNVGTKQAPPVLNTIDTDVLGRVELELEHSASRLVSIYSTRAAAVLRYMKMTETKFSISEEAADLLEIGLTELYPEFFQGGDNGSK